MVSAGCYIVWQTYSTASTSGIGNGCNTATVAAIAAMTPACTSDPEDAQWLSSTLPIVQHNLEATCSNAGLPFPNLASASIAITTALASAPDQATGSTNSAIPSNISPSTWPLSAQRATPTVDFGIIFLCVGFSVAGLIAGAVIGVCNRVSRTHAGRDGYVDEEIIKDTPLPIRNTTSWFAKSSTASSTEI